MSPSSTNAEIIIIYTFRPAILATILAAIFATVTSANASPNWSTLQTTFAPTNGNGIQAASLLLRPRLFIVDRRFYSVFLDGSLAATLGPTHPGTNEPALATAYFSTSKPTIASAHFTA